MDNKQINTNEKIDIVAALSPNPNYRDDFNKRLEELKKLYGMEDK